MKVTTIHGAGRLSRQGRELAAWRLIIISNVLLMASYLLVIRQKFNDNQIVTKIDPNCKVSQSPFPAVAICNFNLVSAKESANIEGILIKNNISQKQIDDFFISLPHLKDYNKESRKLSSNFTDIMEILKSHYFTVDSIMEEVHQKCDSLLLSCSFNQKQKSCSNIFKLVKTYEGHCCAFNYAGVIDDSDNAFTPDPDLEYYDDQNDYASGGRIIMTSEFGSFSGLNVILDVDVNDYRTAIPRIGAKIMISDPNDYPETTILYRYVTPGESLDMKVESMVFQSSSELRRVPADKRGCWFFDEVLLEHTDRYSFETCNTECRMQTFVDHCGCIPYKYPKSKLNRICEFKDLKCLNNVTVRISRSEMNCPSVCYLECRDKKYSITSDVGPFIADGLSPELTQMNKTSELATLQVYFAKSNCNCYKKSLLMDATYFVATYGGIMSIFFGASILTLFELGFIISSALARAIWRTMAGIK